MTASLVSPLQTVGQQKPAKLRALYGYGVWGFATALLLLAASLKGYELSTRPSVVGYQEHRNWLIMQVQAEGLLGLWMVLGPARRWAWYVVTLGFACFVGVTSYEIMTGATNCGCFGLVHVNPWITLLVDAATVIGLWVTRSMWLTRLPKDTITLSRWLPLNPPPPHPRALIRKNQISYH